LDHIAKRYVENKLFSESSGENQKREGLQRDISRAIRDAGISLNILGVAPSFVHLSAIGWFRKLLFLD